MLFRFAGHGDKADGEENLAPDSLAGSAQADQILVPLPQGKNHPPALTQLVYEWLGTWPGAAVRMMASKGAASGHPR